MIDVPFQESATTSSVTTHFQDPYMKLMLWSVLCNMQQMALFMWESGKHNLTGALLAGKLYNLMARLTERDDAKAEVTEGLRANFKLVLPR